MLRIVLVGAWAAGLALLLAACGRPAEPSLNGHWRAEQLQVHSLLLPIGPNLIISDHELFVPATDTRLHIQAVERRGNEVRLQFKAGLGWIFYLESAQRMAIDVPLLGVIHYRRVTDTQHAAPVGRAVAQATQRPTPVAASTVVPPHGAAAVTPVVAARAPRDAPTSRDSVSAMPEAMAALQMGDTNAAIRHLDLALRKRHVDAAIIRDDPRWAHLRHDIRYQALMARQD